MSEDDSPHHNNRINSVLAAVWRKKGFKGFGEYEVFDSKNPFTELMAKEELSDDDEEAIREESWNKFLNFIFADGPHPGVVMRRVYAAAWAFRKDLVGDMSQRDLAKMFAETPAAMNWRINRMFTDYLKSAGVRGRIAGQKTLGAVESYRTAQQGNQNRKGGKKK